MAIFFTVLYVITSFVTPSVLFGPLGQYHLEVIIAALAVLTSIPNFARSRVFMYPQTVAMLLLCVAVPVSIAAGGWLGGAIPHLYEFLTVALPYFLVAANCRKPFHLQWMVLCMFLGSMYFAYHGYMDLQHFVVPSDYLYGVGELRRLRGLGLLNDPNDFAQVMVSLIPCMFLWWKPRHALLNILLCGVPVAFLIFSMFLTHSRGSAVALMIVILVASRRKIGTVPAVALAAVLFSATLATGWSGGRDVSMEAGADRMDAWSVGLEFIKHHPLFGVGAGRFADFNYITAHNTIVVCAAELGLPGFFVWVLFVFSSYRTAMALGKASVTKPEEAAPEEPRSLRDRFAPAMRLLPGEEAPLAEAAGTGVRLRIPNQPLNRMMTPGTAVVPGPALAHATASPTSGAPTGARMPLLRGWRMQEDDGTAAKEAFAARIHRTSRILLLAMTGFLAAGWFLSRALSTWLFVYGGMVFAVYRMAEERGLFVRRDTTSYLLKRSLWVSIALIIIVYLILKSRHFTGG